MRDVLRLAVVAGVLLLGLSGWVLGGYPGAAVALALGTALLVVPWRGQPAWSWAGQYLRRRRRFEWVEPVTVANDRSGGGVRYQDDVAVVAVQVLGRAHAPTLVVGSTTTETANVLDLARLVPAMKQSLGLVIESMSVLSLGSRRGTTGDYPRVYDTLIGTSPYAGQRETWLQIRIRSLDNGDALGCRPTVGTAALAVAQRVAAQLRRQAIRARVATATDIVELERRLGAAALEPHNRRWHTLRGDGGWLTTYAYLPGDLRSDVLAQAWALPADGIVQNLTLFPDGEACATVTVRTAQPPTAAPSVTVRTLPGQQARAAAANLCGPRPPLHGVHRGALSAGVRLPVGPSGVLIGKLETGDRLLLPLSDPGEHTRVHIAAADTIAKRIVIRLAGAGERLTVHTRDRDRWNSVRMPQITVVDGARPVAGTTVSVVDGSVAPAPRPNTVVSVGPAYSAAGASADVLIEQTGPAMVEVTAAGQRYQVEVEFFRAENRYVTTESVCAAAELEMVE